MNTFSGKGKVGLLAVFAVLLMPLLGVGNASAIDVNDQVTVLVPDLQEFPAAPEEMLFTCRAITEHAVWLVQDSSYVDDKGSFTDPTFVPKVVWGSSLEDNLVDPTDFATLTTSFENNVWNTVTSVCGIPEDLNSDGKIVIILASIPTSFNDTGSQSLLARNNMYYADPEFDEIEDEAMEVFYLNIHPFTAIPTAMPVAVQLREWNLADGLSNLSLNCGQNDEEEWLKRGIAGVMQYRCFGMTETIPGKHGIYAMLKDFRKTPQVQLTNPVACKPQYDFLACRGQEFMWLMYLAQRQGDSIISTIAQDTGRVGMQSVAMAINSASDTTTAIQDNVVPIYYDWLVCNLHNGFRSDFADGIYKYDFLEGTNWEDWEHTTMSTAFSLSFSNYPIPGAITAVAKAMEASIWASQYIRFEDYTQTWNTSLNCQYSDGSGANGATNIQWEGLVIKCDDENEQFVSVDTLAFDNMFTTSFTLTEPNTYVILTNNLSGGTPNMRYYISNDTVQPEVEIALHQNVLLSQYITSYCALVQADNNEPEGFDWVGPVFTATIGDSVLNIKMESFYNEVWTGIFPAWASGTYELSFGGYDSTGVAIETLKNVVVGFADTDLTLELESIRLDVPKGGAPNGSMVTLCETGALGLAIESSASINTARGQMTGVIDGPVAIPNVNGTISFDSNTNEAAVYHYTSNGWVMLNSWLQNGEISATVEEGGIYALGEGIGVYAPEIPAQLVLNSNAPNPFAAQTAISFGLPVNGNVSLSIFDMTGRLVTTLANEEMAAANHTVVWDGTDATGSSVGAGVYFCRLETAGEVLTQKMLKVQ